MALTGPTVLVGPGEPAHFECAVDANPMKPESNIWFARAQDKSPFVPGYLDETKYDMAGKTKTTVGSPSNVRNLINGSTILDQNLGVVMLTVLNATAEDCGKFLCLADNGLGQVAERETFLLVRRELLQSNPIF